MEVLGKGSYGYVIKAYSHGEMVARKVMPISKALSAEAIREIACLKLIQKSQSAMKERCVQLLNISVKDDSVQIDMEYVEGGNLYDFLRTAHFGFDIALHLSTQLLEGIQYLHQLRIGHRDLKPENVLITASGQLKICDFGLSRLLQNEPRTPLVCTLYYRAPELLASYTFESQVATTYSFAVDNWSAGCIIREIFIRDGPVFAPVKLSSCPIISAKQQIIEILRHFYGQRKPESDIVWLCNSDAELHDEVSWWPLSKALEVSRFLLRPNPNRRYSATSALTELRRLQDSLS